MIEPVFHLFKIHRKMIFGNPAIIIQNMFGKTPKSLDTVNVILGALVDHGFVVRNGMMFAKTFQGIIASELVSVVDRSFSNLLPNDGHQLFGGHSFDNPRIYPAIALQKPENNAFALCSASASSFASTAKVALVNLNLALKLAALKLGYMVDRFSQALVHSRHCLVINSKIMSQFVRRLTLVKALQYRKFSPQLLERFLFSTGLVSTLCIPTTGAINFERTAKNTLSAPLKVGRTTENVLLPCSHMDILTSTGYYYH